MQRKPAPQKSLDKGMALMGTLAFALASLAVIPLIVIVLYAVVYMPFGVAFLVVAGYLTRRRWAPGLRRRVQSFLSVPEIAPAPRERQQKLRQVPVRIQADSISRARQESPGGPSADLRNTR